MGIPKEEGHGKHFMKASDDALIDPNYFLVMTIAIWIVIQGYII